MTNDDLNRIESSLGITLPERYRQVALRLPDSDSDDEALSDWYPFCDSDQLIERNEQLRSGDFVDGWNPKLFCIGNFEGGDFFVDITDLDKGVFYNTLDASGDGEGAPYNAEDYSASWIESFDDFESRAKSI